MTGISYLSVSNTGIDRQSGVLNCGRSFISGEEGYAKRVIFGKPQGKLEATYRFQVKPIFGNCGTHSLLPISGLTRNR
jgi:hypothetical protein